MCVKKVGMSGYFSNIVMVYQAVICDGMFFADMTENRCLFFGKIQENR
jgi:hypothetical protein